MSRRRQSHAAALARIDELERRLLALQAARIAQRSGTVTSCRPACRTAPQPVTLARVVQQPAHHLGAMWPVLLFLGPLILVYLYIRLVNRRSTDDPS